MVKRSEATALADALAKAQVAWQTAVRELNRRDERLDAVRHHVDRLEAAVGDPHGLDVGAIADAVADLRRAMDGGPDDA